MNRRGAVRALLRAAVGSAGLWLADRGRAQAEGAVAEYQVKAAYLYKFLDFVEWPPNAFDNLKSPFVIGVTGADALADELEALVARRRAEVRPATVRRLRPGESPAGLHVLFIGSGAGNRATQLLSSAAKKPVLTVTETEDAFAAGSVINFVVVEKRVRFDVGLRRAEAHEIKISSRLLSVARKVEGA